MLRLQLSMLALCCLPALLQAAEAERPSCSTSNATLEAFTPVAAESLSHAQADALRRLFRGLGGDWEGHLIEQVCMVSGATQTRDYTAKLKLSGSSNQLRLSGEYVRAGNGVMRRFSRKLLLTGDGLRVDHSSRVGETELRHADATGLRYAQRYRTVHEMPDDPNAPASAPTPTPATAAEQTDPFAALLNLAAQSVVDNEDAAPSDDVVRSSNLVTGEAAPPAQPEPRRRSLSREERFSLQTHGARQLILVQDFYTQGAFTGSMHWQLQRR